MTTADLNKQLTKLNEEFIKIKESGNVTEAFRWIIETQEFLRGLLEETETMKHLTASEREEIKTAGLGNAINHHDVKFLLLERIREERKK